MKPSQISEALEFNIRAGLNSFVWGPPGVGKTETIGQTARRLDRELRVIHTSQLDPVDLRGVPSVADRLTVWNTPDFLPTSGTGVLFFDEYCQGSNAVMNASSQILLERRLGDWIMPAGWCAIAASNNQSDRAATQKLPTHIASRFVHLDFEVCPEEFTRHALAVGFRHEIIAFLRFVPKLLHAFDPKQRSFPCPRTWEFVSEMLDAGPPTALEFELYKGAVGEGAAVEFLAFLKVCRQLPSPDAILLSPDTATVPTDPATLYAICGALARKATDANFAAVAAYSKRMPPEFGVFLVSGAVRSCPAIQQTRAFTVWASDNSGVLI